MAAAGKGHWQIWVDTGGTFTDCVALDPKGNVKRVKILSNSALRGTLAEILSPTKLKIRATWSLPVDFLKGFRFVLLNEPLPDRKVVGYSPTDSTLTLDKAPPALPRSGAPFEVRSPEEAPLLAAKMVTATPPEQALPPLTMRLATTRGTNALLERKGARLAFFVTRGFKDLLRIGTQQRPDLFVLNIQKPELLTGEEVEVPERLSADGGVLEPLECRAIEKQVDRLLRDGVRVAAVALMHSYRNPRHEMQLKAFLLEKGFQYVSCSSELAPVIGFLPRAETAVVDAYLAPVIQGYLSEIEKAISSKNLWVMTSAGGLVRSATFHPKDSLLSGPAGGVVGAVLAGQASGFSKIIAFDMGGTSTDVARFDGDYDYDFEHRVGDAHLLAPALAIESVAAGGGSICGFDGMNLFVGPKSAGSNPGPACYGKGGPLTLTDVNLLLGRLDPARFAIPINEEAAHRAFEGILEDIGSKRGHNLKQEDILQGFLDIAAQRMADAIRRISIRKGYDPRNYALIAFGGAGGQHACAVASQLGIRTILVPRDASLLSAMGLGQAVIEKFAENQVLELLDSAENRLPGMIRALSAEAIRKVQEEGIPRKDIAVRRRIINLRFAGQNSVLQVEWDEQIPVREAFREAYRKLFGYWQRNRPVEVESIRVIASSKPLDAPQILARPQPHPAVLSQTGEAKVYFGEKWYSVPLLHRLRMQPGDSFDGPALITEPHSLTIVEPGWAAVMDTAGALIMKRKASSPAIMRKSKPELVEAELFTNRFIAIANEMGEMLRRTAVSTNVKERLDFSCALLDPQGELVVNAPHIPVHLGSLGMCVRSVQQELALKPGDVVITNHPRFGGSHLPDITVITPVFTPQKQLGGFVASRAHHAEIGGIRPGSMPPEASRLVEEGVVIFPSYLFENGRARWSRIRDVLQKTPFPTRALNENLADIRAAVAANRRGEETLLRLIDEHGFEKVMRYMNRLKQQAENKVRAALAKISNGVYEAVEHLDNDAPLRVRIQIGQKKTLFDFTGSAEMQPNNLNATPAIINSVVMYVLRVLVNEPFPLNEGLMKAVTLKIPPGILNPDFSDDGFRSPAVMGGNVEVSQRLVDTLLKALQLAACSQGTMNNVVFGTRDYSYYETVCGGCGAGPGFHGASAVHSHMTNTRSTDPEILEFRYPVRLETFAIRRESGGGGRFRGGDGVIREIRFLQPMSLSVLGQHRSVRPYGLKGGLPGKSAQQKVIRASGEILRLQFLDGCEVRPGDRFVLETPGGGGYGSLENWETQP